MPGPRRRKPPKHNFPPLTLPDNCSEAGIRDWAKYGHQKLAEYLANHARFDDYCRDHPRPEPSEEEP